MGFTLCSLERNLDRLSVVGHDLMNSDIMLLGHGDGLISFKSPCILTPFDSRV